ncbi:MAG: hypothetical protein ACFBRM_00095 [Pikeienuella sp.]
MKKNATVKFDTSWWRKECPKELHRVKEYMRFVDAVGKYESAERALSIEVGGDESLSRQQLAELQKAATTLKAIEKPRKVFLDHCEDMAKGEKDKKLKAEYDALVEVLKKGVPAAVREELEMLDSLDGDAMKAPMVTPAAHAKYLKSVAPQLKRIPHNFAFALVSSSEHDANRFLFHKLKGARSLANSLKGDVTPKMLCWGTAYGGPIFPGGRYAANVLVLSVQGRTVPGLARRVRVMFQMMGIGTYNRIVIVKDGEELEAIEEPGNEAFEDVAQQSLDVPEDDPEVEKGPVAPEKAEASKAQHRPPQETEVTAPPPPPPPPQQSTAEPQDPAKSKDKLKAELAWEIHRRKLARRVELVIARQWGHWKKVQGLWNAAQKAGSQGNIGAALKAAQAIEKLIAAFPDTPEPKHEEFKRKAQKLGPVMMDLVRQRKGDLGGMAGAWGMAELLSEDGKYEEALAYLNLLAQFIADSDKPPKDDIPKSPEDRRELARDLLAKIQVLSEDLPDAYEILAQEPRPQKDAEKDAENSIKAAHQALHALDDVKGGFDETFYEKDKEQYDFKKAQIAISRLEQMLYAARRKGKSATKTLGKLRKKVDALERRVQDFAHLVPEPTLTTFFRAVSAARGRVARFLKKEDVYGAYAKIGAWENAVQKLAVEAEAFQAAQSTTEGV